MIGAIIGAAATAYAQHKTNKKNSAEANTQREWSAQEAEKDRAWQENMANTAFQRGRADAEAAGINPVLAMTEHGGAEVGSGATGQQGGMAIHQSPMEKAINAMLTQMSARKALAEVHKTEAETDNIDADTDNKITTKSKITTETRQIKQLIEESQQRAGLIKAQIQTELNSAKSERERTNLIKQQSWQAFAEVAKLEKQKDLLEQEIKKAKTNNDWHTAEKWKDFILDINNALRSWIPLTQR